MKKLIPIFLILLGNPATAGEKINVFKPATDGLWGIKRFVIAEFKNNNNTESYIISLLTAKLKQSQFFWILSSDEADARLKKANLTKDSLNDLDKANQLMNLLEVDGIINGEITDYTVTPDETGIEKINKEVWTGEYERDQAGNIIEENVGGQLVKKKKYLTRVIDQRYRIRRGTVSITFNLIDGMTGKVAFSNTMTKSYDSGKIAEEEAKGIPPAEQILRHLSTEVVHEFVHRISPKLIEINREIESGEGFIDEGKIYASKGLWIEAIAAWQKAERMFPNNSAVYYNLGLANEAQGEYNKSEIYYKKAILLKDKKLYKRALEDLRNARGRKLKQLEGMKR